MTDEMTKADRDALVKILASRGKLAAGEAKARAEVLRAEIQDLINAEFSARDKLWEQAVAAGLEAMAKANAEIQAACLDLGIPPKYAPSLNGYWLDRSPQFTSPSRRRELLDLAEARISALVASSAVETQRRVLDLQEKLIVGGLESAQARELFASLPTTEQLMPCLTLDDLGVKRWQPPEDIAAQLVTPLSPAGRRRRQILRAIEANPGASDRKIAEIVGCDHKTVAAHRQGGESAGELPAGTGESTDFSSLRERLERHRD